MDNLFFQKSQQEAVVSVSGSQEGLESHGRINFGPHSSSLSPAGSSGWFKSVIKGYSRTLCQIMEADKRAPHTQTPPRSATGQVPAFHLAALPQVRRWSRWSHLYGDWVPGAQKVIAKEAGCSQSSVSKHINREVKGRKRCGRKKCTSNRDNRTLERIVKQNPFKNVGEIQKEWTAAGVSASRTTMHRRMQDMGFSCRIPCVKPLLNNRQRQKHLAWAKDKKDCC